MRRSPSDGRRLRLCASTYRWILGFTSILTVHCIDTVELLVMKDKGIHNCRIGLEEVVGNIEVVKHSGVRACRRCVAGA